MNTIKVPHVCIITTMHPPDDKRVTHRVGKSLVENGIRTSWVGPGQSTPLNDFGIEFHLFSRKNSLKGRLQHIRDLKRIAGTLEDVDYYYAVDPDSAYVGLQLAKKTRAKTIYDIHERYHDDVIRNRIPEFLFGISSASLRYLISRIIRKTDIIIGVGESVLAPYRKAMTNPLIIRHCFPKAFYRDRQEDPGNGMIRIMHGISTIDRGSLDILETVSCLDENIKDKTRVIFIFPGGQDAKHHDNTREVFSRIDELSLRENIVIHDYMPYHEMIDLVTSCNIGLITYKKRLGENSMPNRFFEYLALGVPMIIPSFSRELVELNKKYNVALVVDTENPKDFSRAIEKLVTEDKLIRELRENGKRAFLDDLNWEKEFQPLIDRIKSADP